MSRPLMQHGVSQLETLFSSSKSDVKVLKQLEHELQYRKVPRAAALLAEVQAAISDAPPAQSLHFGTVPASLPDKSPTTPIQQPELFAQSPEAPTTAATSIFASPDPVSPVDVHQPTASPRPPISAAMPVSEAYKMLKATPGSTWDSIEQTRRSLVDQSHPSRMASLSIEKRRQVQVDAKRVNDAYAILWRIRAEMAP